MVPAPRSRHHSLRNPALAGALLAALGCASAAAGQPTLAAVAQAHVAAHAVVVGDATARHIPHEVVPAPAATVRLVVAPAAPVRVAQAPAARPAVARPAPAVAPHRVAAAPGGPLRNRLISSGGGLNTGVGYYSDCSGRTPLTHANAAIDTCIGGRTYFLGHNPGVFTPLFSLGVGSIITWYDGTGTAHRLRIVAVVVWHHTAGLPALLGGATVQFQTCITSDGSIDRIMDAAPA